MMGNSLTSPKYIELSDNLSSNHNVKMLNPLSNDLSIMRQSMLFNALEALIYNVNRKNSNVKLFEFGKTYHNFKEGRQEPKHLSIIVSGLKNNENWTQNSQKSNFFYFKGIVSALLERLGITYFSETETKNPIFSEGLAYQIGDKCLVDYGIITKNIASNFDIDSEVFYADFKWDNILEQIVTENFKLKTIPKFPKVKRDLALLLDKNVSFDSIRESAIKSERNLLKNINLFDVYTGDKLPENKKSYAISFTLQDEKKTLTDKQIDKIMKKLQQNFEKDFGAMLR